MTSNSADFLSDVHVHLQDRRFGSDLTIVFDRANQRKVERFICSATTPGDWTTVRKIGEEYENVLVTYGIHPWYQSGISGDWEVWLASLLEDRSGKSPYYSGVGEIGLDFAMREKNTIRQEDFFRKQLALANDKKRPIILHTVHSVDQTLVLLKEYNEIPLYLFHGFVGTSPQIEQIVDKGGFFSFSYRNVRIENEEGRETIKQIPRDRILLESDGPSLIPSREVMGKDQMIIMRQDLNEDGFLLNEPALVPTLLEQIAVLKKMPVDEFRRQIQLNEKRFFNSWPKK